MELLDFNYWITLNESQKSYYTFEIPKRELTEIDEAYDKELRDALSSLPESMYDISREDSAVVITLHASQDEILSSVYGESNEVKIGLMYPAKSIAYSGYFKKVSYDSLAKSLGASSYPSKVTTWDDSVQVRFSIQPSELERLIHDRARIVAVPFSVYNQEFTKPDASSFFELVYDGTVEKIRKFTQQFNEYLRYSAITSALEKYLASESTPNLEEIGATTKARLQGIKSIDFNSITSEEKAKGIEEVVEFQRELLSKSAKSDIESPIMTDAMIENFRILLSEVGTVKEIKKRLA
ncbi:hypothetical protein UFOVP972_64 [uncultured Caudovirales phage]|uniref:Uncharacterized protein n=1 Tax=uncultured Caudovirales phage TaxID=2100421 RepID=A0A6J5PYX8_9CAUD|nr:hypothetical protein UFOVP972_64 [uncultured Caudovirales phage]